MCQDTLMRCLIVVIRMWTCVDRFVNQLPGVSAVVFGDEELDQSLLTTF